jgi:hypothetical protein
MEALAAQSKHLNNRDSSVLYYYGYSNVSHDMPISAAPEVRKDRSSQVTV